MDNQTDATPPRVLDMNGELSTDSDRTSPYQQAARQASKIIADFLKAQSPEFARLAELREERKNADNSATAKRTSTFFYTMMQNIGEQLHKRTGVFKCHTSGSAPSSILDFCMAPGGFLAVALKYNRGARAVAFSLPPSDGGHEIKLPPKLNVSITLQDITMLAGDMGIRQLPLQAPNHSDISKLLFEPVLSTKDMFDIVLCDGQVLRTHTRAEYREKREASSLTSVQLALGLEHLRPGGNMIVLLHKADTLSSILLIEAFSAFSSVQLFKPEPQHATRSSFYMIATKVQSSSIEAKTLIEQCKDQWRLNTFGTDAEVEEARMQQSNEAQHVIDDFGNELVQLAKEVWSVQAKALAKAPYIRQQSS